MNILTLQILLTISTLGYSAIPAIFDTNDTHMTNPRWVPHARFHVVWQVASYVGFALIALFFIWAPSDEARLHLWFATAMSIAAYGGFFFAVLSRAFYDGANYDENGVVPYRPPFIGKWLAFEVNITLFSAAVLILTLAVIGLLLPENAQGAAINAVWIVMAILFFILLSILIVFVGAFILGRKHPQDQHNLYQVQKK
ncbi:MULTISPECIES: DUF6640 family protein [Sodalis]|uniref:Uncharacterized protein n=1 Tax=Sodalis ligni TaxID=2697027 RepID=A0A4R1N4W7_9GAMM|nr:DUF6640 family protein [Sodalis ligni]TCL02123.1 hypothetical protein EZJ58_0117 [Sodalis ligni]